LWISAVTAWPVWQERRRVLAVLGVVELAGLAVPIATWSETSLAELDLALMLISLTVTYSLFVAGWEKARRLLLFERAQGMTPDLRATWCFGAAILLPPSLAAAVVAISAVADYPSFNPAGARSLYRWVYSAMASVLATTVASLTFRQHMLLIEALPLAAVIWIAIGAGLTGLAMCASGQFGAAVHLLHFEPHRLELITMGVAIGEYAAYRAHLPLLMWLSLPATVAIQRLFTVAELQETKVSNRPMGPEAWFHIARVVLDASDAVTIVRIEGADLETARIMTLVQGGVDAIGTLPDGGLAVLLPDCPPAQGDAFVRRLRVKLGLNRIDCTVVAASKPRDGRAVEDLLAVCEAELVVSQAASRRSANSPWTV
jgi:hypothetical protein